MLLRRGRQAALAWFLTALAPVGALLGLSGCITDQGTLQVVAAGPTPEELQGIDVASLPVQREVIGRDTRVTSVLLVPTFAGPKLENAVADALAKGGGDLLVGVHVRTLEYWFLIGWSVLEVRGDAVDASARETVR